MAIKKTTQELIPKMVPAPEGEDIISKGTEYFRISKAAEILGCTADDLLHMGATGNAEIMAPVVAKGQFEWPVDGDGLEFPEVDVPFVVEFDAKDRVILSVSDLASIEGKGWTIPRLFYAPSKARELIKNNPVSLSDALERENESKRLTILKIEKITEGIETQIAEKFDTSDESDRLKATRARNSLANWTASLSTPSVLTSEMSIFRERYFYVPWYPVAPVELDAEKTTINHLFILKKELLRLKNGQPQDNVVLDRNKQMHEQTLKPKIHGNTEINALIRESVLKAAIYCLNEFPDKCRKSNVSWAKLIDEKARLFWPEGDPPLSRDKIERMLGDALKLPNDPEK